MKQINYRNAMAINDLKGEPNGSPIDSDLFYDDPGVSIEFSNIEGFGFWCGKKCATKKLNSGQTPKYGKARKDFLAKQAAAAQLAQTNAAAAASAASDTASQKALDSLKPSPSDDKKGNKDNTLMYVGIAGVIVVLGIVGFMMARK